ncbi:MAG: Bifunctional protein Aas [Lentisphaerae bacterium ADurb.BinA184]|nr:MAG: Bifunctional protein Aas [Lentisphaerae bacterium ADurb.BinA184]
MTPPSAIRSVGFRALLATQFLGAFNDNAFRLVVSLAAVRLMPTPEARSLYVALAGGLMTLPYVLFSTYAGYLADRFSKKRLMVAWKLLEVAVMLLAAVAFWLRSPPFMVAVVFLMGAQSALFSPCKYGILPETLPDQELSRGNGAMQMWTFLAIILGTAAGGRLAGLFAEHRVACAAVFVAIAILGTLTSLAVTPVPAAGSRQPFEPLFWKGALDTFRQVRADRALLLCILGSAFFWCLGALFQMNILLYARDPMGLDETHTAYLLTAVALGIGLGSQLAGRWSGEKVEFGLVPLGALTLGLFSIWLSFSFNSYGLTLAVLFMLGVGSAFYDLPLGTYVQQRSPADAKGRVLACSAFLANGGIVAMAGLFWLLQSVLHLGAPLTFLAVGLGSMLVVYYICRLLPEFLLRFLIWLGTHSLYRIRIVGGEYIPRNGGALLVCNHVSHADGFVIQACIQRVVRFLVPRTFYDLPMLRPFFRIMNAIPVAAADGPGGVREALRQAREEVRAGRVVCLFAEGAVTRTGNLLPFSAALEDLMRDLDAPIIPVYLDRMWGSLFSFEGGRLLRRLPSRLPYPCTVLFGRPLPAWSSAFQVRQAVAELGASAFPHRRKRPPLLTTLFCRQARRTPFRLCMADSSGRRLNYAQAAVAALALARTLRRDGRADTMVGILLPSSVPAALVNIAVTLCGKIPVNLNFTAPAESLAAAVRRCGIRKIYTSRALAERLAVPLPAEAVYMEDVLARTTWLDRSLAAAAFAILPGVLLRRRLRRGSPGDPNSLATVVFSSGSTGDPKGVMLSHANIGANIEGIYQILQIRPGDVVLGVMPFFHSFGFTGTLWLPLATGMGAVYHHNPLDAKAIGELSQRFKTTVLLASPTFLLSYARRVEAGQFASLRFVFAGAERLGESVAGLFRERFGIEPLEGYGCTELSPIVAVNIPNVAIGPRRQLGSRRGTLGLPLPGVAVKAVDPETRADRGPGEDGLLLVRGGNVMLGYLGDEARTRDALRDGWYVTGDIGHLDSDGFITITDRLSRFSKIGGEMVSHGQIEQAICRAAAGDAGFACVVTAIPDEQKGEHLIVLYQGRLDIAAVRASLARAGLPNLWIPRADAFLAVENLPLLASGKLDWRRAKALAAEWAAAARHPGGEGESGAAGSGDGSRASRETPRGN